MTVATWGSSPFFVVDYGARLGHLSLGTIHSAAGHTVASFCQMSSRGDPWQSDEPAPVLYIVLLCSALLDPEPLPLADLKVGQ